MSNIIVIQHESIKLMLDSFASILCICVALYIPSAYQILTRTFPSVAVPSSVITLLPLSGEQQAALTTASVVRILENYKTIAAAGGADLRIALLARLIAQVVLIRCFVSLRFVCANLVLVSF